MKNYGHFDDVAREYVIENPATPWPWINYLGNEEFFGLISNTAGGYCFCRDAKFRRILRYRYNNVPMDSGGRYFYIKDADNIWSPGWKPCKTALDSYECRHGMGYTRITGVKDKLKAEVLYFVPLGNRCEVHRLRLSNEGDSAKTFTLFSLVEWCLWNGETDMENFQRNLSIGEVEVDGSVIYHKSEYRERRNHFAFYGANVPLNGFDTDRESFFGLYNGFEAPQNVLAGRCTQSVAHGWSPIAAQQIDIELGAGESREIVFVLGYVENHQDEKFCNEPVQYNSGSGVINKSKAKEMLNSFSSPKQVEDAFNALKEYWDEILGKFQVETSCDKIDRMVNIWNQYQCMVTFNMSRSASFFESGIGRGMGFRDSNQDLVGFVHQIPSRARQRILDIAATQFPDGGCYHQYQPLTKRGNNGIGGGFNDDPLWLLFGTFAYIKETGDFSITREMVPYDNKPGSEKTLLNHLAASFRHVTNNLGPHGLPLIGRADWNDCLNLNCFSKDPNESFQTTGNISEGSKAESLMIAGLFVVVGKDYIEFLRRPEIGASAEDIAFVEGAVEEMSENVKKYGWDGEWFLRAYDFYGNKIGTKDDEEAKIFIESQGWCTMARIGAEEGLCERALDSVKEKLDSPWGIVLNNPAYERFHYEYGEISSYPKGYKENAGIFCHNNPWIIIGEALAGRNDDAFEHYCKISPAFIEDQELHKVEPYVYCQMIAGKDAFKPGEGKNSWLTGTAAWNWYTVSEFLLGIKPVYDGMIIAPKLPSDFGSFKVHRVFRDAVYDITINYTGRGGSEFIPYAPGQHKLIINL